jgi:hypothetical protein
VTKTENTLYILQSLSSTDSEDYLESVEIEVYYEDDQGNEGMSITYDMPTIADEAISTINELEKRIAELEKEREWIDVIDELPKTTMSVLVTDGVKVGELTYVKFVNGTGKWAGNNKYITGWMLKPKPPKTLKDQGK